MPRTGSQTLPPAALGQTARPGQAWKSWQGPPPSLRSSRRCAALPGLPRGAEVARAELRVAAAQRAATAGKGGKREALEGERAQTMQDAIASGFLGAAAAVMGKVSPNCNFGSRRLACASLRHPTVLPLTCAAVWR